VTATWTALAVAGLAFVEAPDTAAEPGPRLWSVLTAATVAAAAVVVLARQDTVTSYALERPSVVLGALAIAALALALPAGTARFAGDR
jgi:drug/metabolite transporter (DMT)-like permease